jgi:hypothetical protein
LQPLSGTRMLRDDCAITQLVECNSESDLQDGVAGGS